MPIVFANVIADVKIAARLARKRPVAIIATVAVPNAIVGARIAPKNVSITNVATSAKCK